MIVVRNKMQLDNNARPFRYVAYLNYIEETIDIYQFDRACCSVLQGKISFHAVDNARSDCTELKATSLLVDGSCPEQVIDNNQ